MLVMSGMVMSCDGDLCTSNLNKTKSKQQTTATITTIKSISTLRFVFLFLAERVLFTRAHDPVNLFSFRLPILIRNSVRNMCVNYHLHSLISILLFPFYILLFCFSRSTSCLIHFHRMMLMTVEWWRWWILHWNLYRYTGFNYSKINNNKKKKNKNE